jgi:hypothetical protein
MRAIALAAVASLAIALPACGSSSVGAGGGHPSSADLLKPGAIAYAQVVTDPGSDEWKQVESLVKKFPDGEEWFEHARADLDGLSWEDDVQPALGEVADVAVYTRRRKEPHVVVLTKPADRAKLDALVAKQNAKSPDDRIVTREVGDWVAISNSEAAIDAALSQGGESLADDQGFQDAMRDLPGDALAKVYVDPSKAAAVAGSTEQTKALGMLGLDQLDFAGGWAKATDDGAELGLALRGDGANSLFGAGDPYTSKLLERVPDDAIAVATFRADGVRRQLDQFRRNPMFAAALKEFEEEYGVGVDELTSLLNGEVLIYVRKGLPIPELTLVIETDDEARAKTTIDKLFRSAGKELGGLQLTTGTFDGALVVSTGRNAVAELEDDGDKLPDSGRFEDALDTAGAPDEYTGLLYVDLADATDLLLGYLGVSGQKVPEKVSENLAPLKSLVAFGRLDGTLATSRVFVGID